MSIEYFDDLSELIEDEAVLSQAQIFERIGDTDRGTLDELLDDYFTDIVKGVPEDAGELDLLFENIRTYFRGLTGETKEERIRLSEELIRFRSWFLFENKVRFKDSFGNETFGSISEALAFQRMALLGEVHPETDFSGVPDFPMEAYDMSFGVSRIVAEQETDVQDRKKQPVSLACECDDDDAEDYIDDNGWNTLINRKNPVIDGEFSDADEKYTTGLPEEQ